MAHILLIEDDPGQVVLVERWLPEHQVVVVDGGPGTREAMAKPWDLVISDVQLPDTDGISLMEARGAGAPTLIITSKTRFDVALSAMRAGAADLLPKPFSRSELNKAVETLLATAGQRRRRVLAIGAHPDDVEIGIGGTLARHAADGDDVTILTLSRGSAGGEVGEREVEAAAAANLLRARLLLEDLPDRSIGAGPDTIGAIEAAIRSVRPDVVYTHSPNDRHQDHRAVYEATCVAARSVQSVYGYQSPSTTIAFQPTKFVDIGETLATKLAALEAYRSQAGREYMTADVITSTASYWGRFARYGQVEPLEIYREA